MSASSAPGSEAPGRTVPDGHWAEVERSAEFRELVGRRRSLVLPGLIVFVVWFGGFLVLTGYARGFMGSSIYQGFTVAYALALSQIPMTWLVVLAYLRGAERHVEPLERRAAEVAERAPR
jgi:uncharacterized membrane protein (DUF485 family)